jgi:hypothetical protein
VGRMIPVPRAEIIKRVKWADSLPGKQISKK